MGKMMLLMLIGFAMCFSGIALSMARVTLGSVLNSISGSIDQMVYSTWKGINYIRSKAKTISNPQSADQMDVRSRVAECAKYWYDTLTDGERAAWEAYSKTIVIPSSGPGDIIKPSKGPFSGYTAFLRNNILLFTSGQAPLGGIMKAAPIGITPPNAPVSFNASGTGQALNLDWLPGNVPGAWLAAWVRSITIGIHAQIAGVCHVVDNTITITSVKATKGVSIPLTAVTGKFDVQIMAVDDYGQPSPASVLKRDVNIAPAP